MLISSPTPPKTPPGLRLHLAQIKRGDKAGVRIECGQRSVDRDLDDMAVFDPGWLRVSR
jgi:hypothetical protein